MARRHDRVAPVMGYGIASCIATYLASYNVRGSLTVAMRTQHARDGRKQLNVRVPWRLHTRLKLLAVRRGVAMDDLVERAIRYLLRRRRGR
jgi:hypothetical protein